MARETPSVQGFLERWPRFWTTRSIVIGTAVSLVLAWSSVEFMSRYLSGQHRGGPQASVASHAIAYAFLIVTATIVVGSVVAAFRQGSRRVLLRRTLTSYFCLMLVFASMYYEVVFIGDFQDAVFKYDRYRADALGHHPLEEYRDQRPFFGIEHRFWTGVDWMNSDRPFVNGIPATFSEPSVGQMRALAAGHTLEETVRFIPSARLAIFADCLHFSVATMTTVGYGDIAPRSFAVRLAADSEAVCDTLLLIFGLGLIFGNWRPQANG